MIEIPKKLGHIWIGPYSPPLEWMNTWKDKHASWQYTLYDNQFLETYCFRTRPLIDEYLKRKQYAGVADLMRYELLYEFGGLIPGADSICYHNTDELWSKPCPYTVYENEFVRGELVSPIQASPPKNEFVAALINELCKLKPASLDEPWISTGNLFVAQMIEKYQPDIVIYPAYYFIPVHYTGIVYKGTDKVYAKQLFGSTHNSYKTSELSLDKGLLARLRSKKKVRKEKEYARQIKKQLKHQKAALFDLDFE